MQQSPVIFSEQLAVNGKVIAIAELNATKALNALSLPMILLLTQQLNRWQSNDSIAVVILKGAGDKAFCAGGDVVSLYHHFKNESFPINDEKIVASKAIDFFQQEYQLDQLIHDYTKPILAWADGYVMGGGVGLMAGASHRVSTEKTLMAMPEVTIGLYPDVGASWFLNKMPDNIGLFLGLTGAMFNGVDAQYLGLADYLINSNTIDDIVEQLLKTNWNRDSQNHKLLNNILSPLAIAEKNQPESLIVKHRVIIAELTKADNVFEIYQNIIDCDLSGDNEELFDSQWLEQAQKKIQNGSPLSCALIYQQLKQSENYTLAQCFKSELNLSLRCCQQKEFSEGVRALLVDKDRNPQWRYKNINDIDDKIIEWFFVPLSIK
ncbi:MULTISPECIES: enoyl-CoA hydratase/isomerase family protein [unclassified Colwellia]|uniref:enoyl-CoA hydratase/isomerase family protein n=1 Tax=unclassified Colwellia TaxID=196834 RepID=UPI0015F499E0|nr:MULTISPECIES: enoyl-CoA hydratase/isomerase family protein [unclassified Colwellia]MBA6233136.1 enoyl-CoA hydratase/isomerase family protein [Colwellia sp. MB02u-7]MBA6236814.1 enoyl-CoA hydratase/isomerase family protein [Colwellia sp. MB02u-11]MBA6256011.1 enoyl-CoA hydratase/isomerase family protein [Colwellia sp. MB3u-28]MBA6259180.1 enoyl-CoA hydratase/isomerase family protein [Colwellia sp. MB3u-41]MBA6299223.1 enoyl-CoA hydratase/isomerase family protein [Colwellia sp. MB3u-22]